MSISLILACLWALVANVIAMMPSKDNHWRNAYVLTAAGIPIVGYVTVQHGPWVAIFVLAAGCSVLRWPLIYLGRWLRRGLGGGEGPAQ
ncbi:MAG: DUF2484 family protein [Sulfitobacter sp.]|nr:DUF2484 family protein [Sulfitobacter sp.]